MAPMNVPAPVAEAIAPLMEVLSPAEAMEQLVVGEGASPELIRVVETVTAQDAVKARPALCSALWLYVDELDRSHVISQQISDATGSFWHGIMHRREGDFSNSHYWFHRVGTHPAMASIEGYDAHAFIDEVEERHRDGAADLVDLQRREWAALFEWCCH